jgi:hypothetical protein
MSDIRSIGIYISVGYLACLNIDRRGARRRGQAAQMPCVIGARRVHALNSPCRRTLKERYVSGPSRNGHERRPGSKPLLHPKVEIMIAIAMMIFPVDRRSPASWQCRRDSIRRSELLQRQRNDHVGQVGEQIQSDNQSTSIKVRAVDLRPGFSTSPPVKVTLFRPTGRKGVRSSRGRNISKRA